MEEVRGSLHRHERYQVVLQHLLISFTVHGGVFGQKEEAPIAPSTGKAAPDHHGGGILHRLHRVLVVEAIGAGRPSHQAPGRPDDPDHRLIGEHYLLPFRCSPVMYFLQKCILFFFIWLVSIGFRAATPHLKVLLEVMLHCVAASSGTEVFS